ncbi:MAG TPA: PEP-CTERM sorting domain-containing protein [Bryobacteraceae bacterium]|nr:PEP-CTERM sorting domain-containing protein [Bryobacteraceae bacterium]
MKRALLLFALVGGFSLGSLKADVVPFIVASPTLTLDPGSPTADGQDWDWNYTLSSTVDNIWDIFSVTIFDIGGVVAVSAPNGWTATDTPVGGGGYNVEFEQSCNVCVASSNSSLYSVGGFTVESTTNIEESANYSILFANTTVSDPVVGGPSTNSAVPEPASITLMALVLLGVGGGLRRSLR